MHYVYIIYSKSKNVYYKGYSIDPESRLKYHNDNRSKYTKMKGPWVLVYIRQFESKKEALIEEKRLKKLNRKSIIMLIG